MSKSYVGSALGCVLGAAALLAPPTSFAQGDGWRPCADEGQTCQVNGRTVVRYGSPSRWVTRTVAGAVECSNAAFGDPDPGVKKRCEVHAGSWDDPSAGAPRGSTNTGWTFCAAEGELCHFKGQTEIRFGQGRQFNIRTAENAIQCAVEDFGDPVPGVTKYCEVRSSAALAGNVRRDAWRGGGNAAGNVPDNAAWRYCATEGEVCRIRGRAEVRFGEGRRYVSRNVRDEVNCDVSTFGDPARGIRKHCEVRAAALNDGGGANWNGCAREGGNCEFNGQAQVRYGAAGRYVYRDAYNGVRCDNASFGSDPFVGRSKTCEIRR